MSTGTAQTPIQPADYIKRIRAKGISIYEPIEVGSELWIPSETLEVLLDEGLRGFSVEGFANRTRSKKVKEKVCEILGYPVPETFEKTQPRFPGQCFDTYIQKATNLQVWNEEVSPTRRYVIIQVTGKVLTKVRVITGDELTKLVTTGTLTQKYQARLNLGEDSSELISVQDTTPIQRIVSNASIPLSKFSPVNYPDEMSLLPVSEVFERLKSLVGKKFDDAGCDQERNRGAKLHELVCEALGYPDYRDHGQFPDIRHQLLEVKLQTAPTIDLGLIAPNSTDPLDTPKIRDVQVRHCDVRYALFYGIITKGVVELTHLFLTTGQDFFTRFPQFQGKIINRKLQIRLPKNFFSGEAKGRQDDLI